MNITPGDLVNQVFKQKGIPTRSKRHEPSHGYADMPVIYNIYLYRSVIAFVNNSGVIYVRSDLPHYYTTLTSIMEPTFVDILNTWIDNNQELLNPWK